MNCDADDFGCNAGDGHDPAQAGEGNSGPPEQVDGPGSVEAVNGPEAGAGGCYAVALEDILILARDWFHTHCLSEGGDGWDPRGPAAGGEPPTPGGGEGRGPEARFGGFYPVDREDILALARHWYKTLLGLEYFEFWAASHEWKSVAWASSRFARVARMVGEAEADKIIREERADLRRRAGEWGRVFFEGTAEEVARVQREAHEGLRPVDATRWDEATRRAAHEYLKAHPRGAFFDAAGDLWYLAESTGEQGEEPARLVLSVRTRYGDRVRLREYPVDPPPDWSAPYALG
jgi:hypothetical protein